MAIFLLGPILLAKNRGIAPNLVPVAQALPIHGIANFALRTDLVRRYEAKADKTANRYLG